MNVHSGVSLGSFLLGFLLVFLLYRTQPFSSVEDNNLALETPTPFDYSTEAALPDAALSDQAKQCLENVETCPHFSDGQLDRDWAVRFWKTNRGGCYFEFDSFSASCADACDALFVEHAPISEARRDVATKCKIGCGFAKRMRSSGGTGEESGRSCVMDCKRTAWPSSIASSPQALDSDKACEIGCLIGNERVCPFCDARAAVALA